MRIIILASLVLLASGCAHEKPVSPSQGDVARQAIDPAAAVAMERVFAMEAQLDKLIQEVLSFNPTELKGCSGEERIRRSRPSNSYKNDKKILEEAVAQLEKRGATAKLFASSEDLSLEVTKSESFGTFGVTLIWFYYDDTCWRFAFVRSMGDPKEPNQRPERNAGATSDSTTEPPAGVAHP